MFIMQYEFLIEFYGIKGRDAYGAGIPEDKPKYIIETKNGSPEVNISIYNVPNDPHPTLRKEVKFSIFNMPLNFNDNVKFNDIVRISYKKYAHGKSYTPIMMGYLGHPMDTDYESGDFSVDYTIHFISKSSFYTRNLKNKQFKGYTVENAIREVFGDRAKIDMKDEDKLKVIKNGFYAETPEAFVEKLRPDYVRYINIDVSESKEGISTVYVFKNYYPRIEKVESESKHRFASFLDSVPFSKPLIDFTKSAINDYDKAVIKNALTNYHSYKRLEDYHLLFIPQQDITTGIDKKCKTIFWNAQTLYTHTLNTGDKVQFTDRAGTIIWGELRETSATLSNVGDCLLNLRIYDEESDK